MKIPSVLIVGMVWYKPEDYDTCRRIMRDGDKFPASYHLWRMNAETGEKRLRRAGKTVVRAFIDPETFPDWCRARGLDLDAHARNQFASWIAYQVATGGEQDPGIH